MLILSTDIATAYRCLIIMPRLSTEWVVPEKIHTSTTDGILEILAGGGSKTLEIQAGGVLT